MPGYGIADANAAEGLLPWEWAVERLVAARNYWIATSGPDGRPHCVPVWGVWFDDRFYFSTGEKSRKARNLSTNPSCVVCPENGDQAISLEGVATKTTDVAKLTRLIAHYTPKYEWKMTLEDLRKLGPVFEVRPRKVIAVDDTPGRFETSPTRWEFDAD